MSATSAPTDALRLLAAIGNAARRATRSPPGREPIPFVLVTGFLGSGKTTLLRNLLQHGQGEKLAVLVNDFGEINIDAALIRRQLADTIELSNGCVCCDISNGLDEALAGISARPVAPDAIVLEASGIVDPNAVLHQVIGNPALRLSGVIVLIDASTFISQLEDPIAAPIVTSQVTAADLVILNKADLATSEAMEAARRRVDGLREGARVLETVAAAVPAEVVMGVDLPASRPRTEPAADKHHHISYRSWILESDRTLDERKLCALAGALPTTILRAKGFVRVARDPAARHLLQVVGRRWSLTAEGPWTGGADGSQVVVIGSTSEAEIEAVRRRFAACET